jgi:uncharacterized OsmC-like protein
VTFLLQCSQVIDAVRKIPPGIWHLTCISTDAGDDQPASALEERHSEMKLQTVKRTNGVEVDRLHETISAVSASPELGRFTFQITNQWIDAGQNRSEARSFQGQGQVHVHKTKLALAADEPEILLGRDTAANPVEHLLHALASCVTTSMVYHAAARGISIEGVESSLEGDLDLRGFLGIDPTVRNGYQQIRIKLRIKGNLTDEQLEQLSNLGPTFSPVFDSLRNGVPISVSAERIEQ